MRSADHRDIGRVVLDEGVVVVWVVVWATGTVGIFDVADTRVLQAFEAIRNPALTDVAEVAGVLASATAIYALWLINWVVLIAARRWRHLFVAVEQRTAWFVRLPLRLDEDHFVEMADVMDTVDALARR